MSLFYNTKMEKACKDDPGIRWRTRFECGAKWKEKRVVVYKLTSSGCIFHTTDLKRKNINHKLIKQYKYHKRLFGIRTTTLNFVQGIFTKTNIFPQAARCIAQITDGITTIHDYKLWTNAGAEPFWPMESPGCQGFQNPIRLPFKVDDLCCFLCFSLGPSPKKSLVTSKLNPSRQDA